MVSSQFRIKPEEPLKFLPSLNTFVGGHNDGTVVVNENVRMYRRVLAILPRRTEECYIEFLRLLLEAAVNVHGIDYLRQEGYVQWR